MKIRPFCKDRKKDYKCVNILSTLYLQEIQVLIRIFKENMFFFDNILIFIDKSNESFLHLARSNVILVMALL
jgi:hypothetical protein